MNDEARRFRYKGYIIEPRSEQVREGPNNLAGWVPKVWLERHEGGSVETFPISLPDRIVPAQEEADRIALQLARQWIDANG